VHAITPVARPQEVDGASVDTISVTGTADWRDSEISRLRRRVVELEREVERLHALLPPPRAALAVGARVSRPELPELPPDKRPAMYVPPEERSAGEEHPEVTAPPKAPPRRRLFWHSG